MKNHVFCLDPNCGAEYSLRDLKVFHSYFMMNIIAAYLIIF